MWPAQLLKLQKKKKNAPSWIIKRGCTAFWEYWGFCRWRNWCILPVPQWVSLHIVVQMQPWRLIAMKMFCHQTPLWLREEISQFDIKLIVRAFKKTQTGVISFSKRQARHSAQALQLSKTGDILTLDAVDVFEGGVTATLVVRGTTMHKPHMHWSAHLQHLPAGGFLKVKAIKRRRDKQNEERCSRDTKNVCFQPWFNTPANQIKHILCNFCREGASARIPSGRRARRLLFNFRIKKLIYLHSCLSTRLQQRSMKVISVSGRLCSVMLTADWSWRGEMYRYVRRRSLKTACFGAGEHWTSGANKC